ncbi:MAG: hypothetical protein RL199_1829, partial [Pseudomonadota bacterium]
MFEVLRGDASHATRTRHVERNAQFSTALGRAAAYASM